MDLYEKALQVCKDAEALEVRLDKVLKSPTGRDSVAVDVYAKCTSLANVMDIVDRENNGENEGVIALVIKFQMIKKRLARKVLLAFGVDSTTEGDSDG